MTWQLRLYGVREGEWDDWVREWRAASPERAAMDPDPARHLTAQETILMEPL